MSVKQLWKKIGDKIFQYRFYKFADELRVNPDRCERGVFESAKKNFGLKNIRIRMDGRLLLIPRWDRISRYKLERKKEKDFGRSSKITPSCK